MKKKEYIERGALLKKIQWVTEYDETGCGIEYRAVSEEEINNAPAADVVEVVRCKDCKRSGMYEFGCGDREHLACLDVEEDGFVIMATAVNYDDFCSRGERKEE